MAENPPRHDPDEIDEANDSSSSPEQLDKLPLGIRQIIEASASVSYSSPYPIPDHLERYEQIVPGSAERIIALSERQAAHRQALEHKLMDAEIEDRRADRRERRLGQIFGFSIGCLAIIAGAVVAILGYPWAGGFIGSGGVAGLVSVFVIGRKMNVRDEGIAEDNE